jgi:hypothetical protein
MGYGHNGLGQAVSADTAAYRALHAAALAIIAARNQGDANAQAVAQKQFNALAGSNAERVAALKAAESADTGLFGGLTATIKGLGTLGKLALAAALLYLIARSGILRGQLRNPLRRHRRRGRRR